MADRCHLKNRKKLPCLKNCLTKSKMTDRHYFKHKKSTFTIIDNKNRRNDEVWAHIAMWARTSLFRRYTNNNVQGTGFVKIWNTRHKNNIRGYTDIFTVYMRVARIFRRWVRLGVNPGFLVRGAIGPRASAV